jgi:Spy/CpxP family protein refolding chaperone
MRKLLMTMTATAMAVAMAAIPGQAQRGGGPTGDGPPRAAGPDAAGRPRAGKPEPGPMRGRRGGALLGGLKLTDEQRQQARDVLLKSRDESAPLVDQLQLARKDLRREIFADKRDGGRLKDLSAKVEALQKQVAEIRLKARTSIAGLLTPEQRQQMRAAPMRPVGAGPRGRRAGPRPASS